MKKHLEINIGVPPSGTELIAASYPKPGFYYNEITGNLYRVHNGCVFTFYCGGGLELREIADEKPETPNATPAEKSIGLTESGLLKLAVILTRTDGVETLKL